MVRRITGSCYMTLSNGSNLGLGTLVGGGSVSAKYWVYATENGGNVGVAVASAKQDETISQQISLESMNVTISSALATNGVFTPTSTVGLRNGMPFSLKTGGNLPASFSTANQTWWIRDLSSTTFTAAAFPGAAATGTTGSGDVGVHTYHAQHYSLVTSSTALQTAAIRLIGAITPSYTTVGGGVSWADANFGNVDSLVDDISAKYRNSVSTMSGSLQTVTFIGREWDTHNAMGTGNPNTYTVPVTGKYQITSQVQTLAAYAAGSQADMYLMVNGAAYIQNSNVTAGTVTKALAGVSDVVRLNAYDYVNIQVATSGVGSSFTKSSITSFFSICKIWP